MLPQALSPDSAYNVTKVHKTAKKIKLGSKVHEGSNII